MGRRAIDAQCQALQHRGPDDSGLLIDQDFGFGMRRLSILDIPDGHQPMTTPDGRFAIIFNGEIFNHLSVRQEIGSRYRFTTRSDTETILAAFATWANDAWSHLEGMFAVAVWDKESRTLTLARDPLGIKPLFVSQQSGGVSFASELKAITLLPSHDFTINERALDDFFTFGHVRRPRTIYQEVTTLEPGCFMTIGPTGPASTSRYWRAEFRRGPKLDDDDWIEEARERLLATTARHMQSDVPTAALLSGGIDSSIVLATMARSTSARIQAFTIGHPGHSIDESEAAGVVARHLGCEHIVAPLLEEEVIACLPEIAACYDEPFADIAAIPTWFVSRLAAGSVKVVLCGEGGDELFCGYKRHRTADAIARHRQLAPAASIAAGMIERLPTTPWPPINRWRQYAGRFREFVAADDGYQQLFLATQISSEDVRQRLYSKALDRANERTPQMLEQAYFSSDRGGASSPLDEFTHADLTLNLPSQMLARLDRASMAHSLEARVPFLSHKMVEWALTIPENLKLRNGVGKYILRRAAEPWLPAEILKRPKQGFQIPLASWLRKGPVAQFMEETIEGSGVGTSGYFDPVQLKKLAAEHRAGAADHSRILYAALIFALWWERSRAGRQRVEAGVA